MRGLYCGVNVLAITVTTATRLSFPDSEIFVRGFYLFQGIENGKKSVMGAIAKVLDAHLIYDKCLWEMEGMCVAVAKYILD